MSQLTLIADTTLRARSRARSGRARQRIRVRHIRPPLSRMSLARHLPRHTPRLPHVGTPPRVTARRARFCQWDERLHPRGYGGRFCDKVKPDAPALLLTALPLAGPLSGPRAPRAAPCQTRAMVLE